MPTPTSVPWSLSWSMCVPTVKIIINDTVFLQGGRVYQGDPESPVCIPCAFPVHFLCISCAFPWITDIP